MAMLEQVLNYLNNWFTYKSETYHGRCSITDGVLTCGLALRDGAYYRILGSRFHDGLYQHLVPAKDLEEDGLEDEEEKEEPINNGVDEVFFGSVSLCALPASFLDLVNKMDAWQVKYGEAMSSPYQSESFGGYSYSKAGSSSSTSGTATVWTQFADVLAPYKRPPMARAVSASGQSYQGAPYRRPFNTDFRR